MVAAILVLLGAQGIAPATPVVAAPPAATDAAVRELPDRELSVLELSVREPTAVSADPPTSSADPTSSTDPTRMSRPGDQLLLPRWSWPLGPTPEVMRSFDRPAQRWERGHRGVDLSSGVDRPPAVLSPADGVVSFAGTVVDRGVLSIDHGGGRISSFEPVTTSLVRGDRVGKGQEVAVLESAGGGHCSRGCLHWGVRVEGQYVDPLIFVLAPRPSVLLPLDVGAEK